MIPVVNPPVALRWLGLARRAFLVSQAAFVLLAAAADPGVPALRWLIGLAVAGALDAAISKGVDPAAVRRHAVLDLLGITAALLASGGSENPVGSFLLVELALLAVVLPPKEAWLATGTTLLLHATTVFCSAPLHGLDNEPHEHVVHLIGHMLAFDVAAVAITALVGRLSGTLRAREESLRAALVRHADDERLAALGTLAVGTAHALGTPLGAIELLAEEMALDLPSAAPGREAWAALRGEVARSRGILDRLLSGDEGIGGSTTSVGVAIEAWVSAWRRARSDVKLLVEVQDGIGVTVVRGGESGWRDAVWTVLDNAARASGGDGVVRLVARREEDEVAIEVSDEGPAVDEATLARAGQPFHSGWPGRPGNGLGLYVARRFARGTGGDIVLTAGQLRGVRVTLSLPVEGR